MTEKEKMLAGEIYDCGDPELLQRWHYAKELQLRYNNTDSRNSEELSAILDELLGSHGDNVWISAPFFVDYGENIHIGSHVEINMNCVFLDCNRITIGDNCGIGPGVHIYAVTHPVNPTERLSPNSQFWKSLTAPVTIGNNVWIGGSSVVLPGVTIGDNVTIGAGSVVTKDIPSNSLAVGNPCRVIREV
ncbi:sugar O-acetyltransferase [Bacteroides faecium]|uniref:Nodulation protein L n=1 Tax=Bacteroides faecium TaxID=2715212 RepID=A0A6H0KJN7_9BACE|nr:sugar O-acetyltransferase [Bacteroides faecium]QIU92778.1 sugar O-acetyltransferase [Bacteroides faecium]